MSTQYHFAVIVTLSEPIPNPEYLTKRIGEFLAVQTQIQGLVPEEPVNDAHTENILVVGCNGRDNDFDETDL